MNFCTLYINVFRSKLLRSFKGKKSSATLMTSMLHSLSGTISCKIPFCGLDWLQICLISKVVVETRMLESHLSRKRQETNWSSSTLFAILQRQWYDLADFIKMWKVPAFVHEEALCKIYVPFTHCLPKLTMYWWFSAIFGPVQKKQIEVSFVDMWQIVI